MLLHRIGLAAVLCGLYAQVCIAQQAPSLMTPDKEAARLFDGVATPSESQLHQVIADIAKVSDGDVHWILDQVIAYWRTGDEQEGWNALFIMKTLLDDYPVETLDKVTPFLTSNDEELAGIARSVIEHIVFGRQRSEQHASDLLADYLREREGEVALSLIGLLFERRPSLAFDAQAKLHRESWANRDEPDRGAAYKTAVEQAGDLQHAAWLRHRGVQSDRVTPERECAAVRTLSRSPLWWARAYAAGTMGWRASLRDPETIDRLRTDEHPIVRDLAAKNSPENAPRTGP